MAYVVATLPSGPTLTRTLNTFTFTVAPSETEEGAGVGGITTSDPAVVYDFEGGNNQTVLYRARALHDYSGVYAASDWVSASMAWSSPGQWWLKSVTSPALNQLVTIDSEPGYQRPGRQGRFQPLGRSRAIVVSDSRGTDQGTIVLRIDTDSAAAALEELYENGGTLLLQGPPGNHWTDRYISVGDVDRKRLIDKGFIEGWLDTISWIEVDAPAGGITAWRDVGS